jgi:hypothetical protein
MKIRSLLVAIAAMAIFSFFVGPVAAQKSRGSLPNYLFSQYYTQGGVSTAHAEMYPAPHPVPRHVGHTYYTYQPLMPHEMMYTHSRNYYNYYAGPEVFYRDMCGGRRYPGGSGLTKTTVKWQNGCMHMGPLPGNIIPVQRLQDALYRHRYCVPGGFLHGAGPLAHLHCSRGGQDCGYWDSNSECSSDCGSSDCESSFCGESSFDEGCSDCQYRGTNWSQKAASTARMQSGRVLR